MSKKIKFITDLNGFVTDAVEMENSLLELFSHVRKAWSFTPSPESITVRPFEISLAGIQSVQWREWNLHVVLGEFPNGVTHQLGFVDGPVRGNLVPRIAVKDPVSGLPIYTWDDSSSIADLLEWLGDVAWDGPPTEIVDFVNGKAIVRRVDGSVYEGAVLAGTIDMSKVLTLHYTRDMDHPVRIMVDYELNSVIAALEYRYGRITSRSLVCYSSNDSPDSYAIAVIRGRRMINIARSDRYVELGGSLPKITFTQFDSILTPSAPEPIELVACETELLNCLSARLVTNVKVDRLQLVPQRYLDGYLVHVITAKGEVAVVGMTDGPVYDVAPSKRKLSAIEFVTLRREDGSNSSDHMVPLNCVFENSIDGQTVVSGVYHSGKVLIDGQPRWVSLHVDLQNDDEGFEVTFCNIHFWDGPHYRPTRNRLGVDEKWLCVGYKLTGILETETFCD